MEVTTLKTYQDLMEINPLDETARMDFVLTAIRDHKSTKLYRDAVTAQHYYDGENVTIGRYEKILYDLQGRAHKDMYTANHKIADQFFPKAVVQKAGYLLGNGIGFDDDHEKQLGANFDERVMDAAIQASVGGVSFGFYDFDHVQIFRVTEFVPLYDEETAAIKAGIRFWQLDDTRPLRAILYEMDGYTGYIMRRNEDMDVLEEKRPYIRTVRTSESDGKEILDGQNYPGFPIVPLKNNDRCRNDLLGRRNTLDALDLACSNMVNNVDEGNLIYWVLKNCGGMDDLDDAKFIDRVKTIHVAHSDTGEGDIEAHAIEAPFAGTDATIQMLEKRLLSDFQCFDSDSISSGSQTATAIRAAYAPIDLKTDLFEMQVTAFILGILALAGIEDKPTYTRNRIPSSQEDMQVLLMAAEYLSEEYVTQKALTILGDADRFEEVQRQKSGEELTRINQEAEPPVTTLPAEPTQSTPQRMPLEEP